MPLSEDEKSRLDEIEAHVRATDPDFVQRLRTGATFRHPSMAPVAEPARVVEPPRGVVSRNHGGTITPGLDAPARQETHCVKIHCVL